MSRKQLPAVVVLLVVLVYFLNPSSSLAISTVSAPGDGEDVPGQADVGDITLELPPRHHKYFFPVVVVGHRAMDPSDENCTHYVDNQVSIDGDGSLDEPWPTILEAIGQLQPGDTLCIRGSSSTPGRVYRQSTIRLMSSGTVDAPITVRAFPGELVVLQSDDYNILEIGASYWHIRGLEFDKRGDGGYAIQVLSGDGNQISECEIHNGSEYGIRVSGGNETAIVGCDIHDFDRGPYDDAYGVFLSGGVGTEIRDNEIYDCTGDGVQFGTSSEVSGTVIEYNHIYTTLGPCSENAIDIKGGTGTVVRGNVMHGFRHCDGSCGGTGSGIGAAIVVHMEAGDVFIDGNEIYDSGTGIRVINAAEIWISNNLIHDIIFNPDAWTNVGINIYRASTANILNNTLADIPRYALQVSGDRVGHLDIRNNLFCNTGQVHYEDVQLRADYNGWFNAAERIEGAHDVVGSDPKFVAPGDYHLRAVSPAVDVGDTAGSPVRDFDGKPRPYGPGVDLGAFEVQEPLPVTDLWVSEAVTTTDSLTVTLTWTAPGRVGQSTTADHCELRYDEQAFTQESWGQATVVDTHIAAGRPGKEQHITVRLPWSGSDQLYFALRIFDADGHTSEISNLAFWPAELVWLPLAHGG